MIWLDNSRILAIFAVVLLHVTASVLLQTEFGSTSWWISNFYDSLVRWCVPVFLMISGALLLDPEKKEDLKTFYVKRLSRILIPIIFWSLFFLLFSYLKNKAINEPVVTYDLIENLISGRPYYHMWYLYMIISIYVFTPFFRKVIAASTKNEIVIFSILISAFSILNAFFGNTTDKSPFFINWFISYLPYFFIGYLVRISMVVYPRVIFVLLFFVSFFATFIGNYYFETAEFFGVEYYFYGNLSVTVFLMSISIIVLMKGSYWPVVSHSFSQRLASLTFGVYLIHPVFISLINYLGLSASTFNPAVSIPIISCIVFTISMCAAWVISKIPYMKRII